MSSWALSACARGVRAVGSGASGIRGSGPSTRHLAICGACFANDTSSCAFASCLHIGPWPASFAAVSDAAKLTLPRADPLRAAEAGGVGAIEAAIAPMDRGDGAPLALATTGRRGEGTRGDAARAGAGWRGDGSARDAPGGAELWLRSEDGVVGTVGSRSRARLTPPPESSELIDTRRWCSMAARLRWPYLASDGVG